jgi:hypothetical protein
MKLILSADGTNIANYFLRYHTMQSCGSGVFKEGTVYLLTIYDKSDIENLTDKEILELVKLIP